MFAEQGGKGERIGISEVCRDLGHAFPVAEQGGPGPIEAAAQSVFAGTDADSGPEGFAEAAVGHAQLACGQAQIQSGVVGQQAAGPVGIETGWSAVGPPVEPPQQHAQEPYLMAREFAIGGCLKRVDRPPQLAHHGQVDAGLQHRPVMVDDPHLGQHRFGGGVEVDPAFGPGRFTLDPDRVGPAIEPLVERARGELPASAGGVGVPSGAAQDEDGAIGRPRLLLRIPAAALDHEATGDQGPDPATA